MRIKLSAEQQIVIGLKANFKSWKDTEKWVRRISKIHGKDDTLKTIRSVRKIEREKKVRFFWNDYDNQVYFKELKKHG